MAATQGRADTGGNNHSSAKNTAPNTTPTSQPTPGKCAALARSIAGL